MQQRGAAGARGCALWPLLCALFQSECLGWQYSTSGRGAVKGRWSLFRFRVGVVSGKPLLDVGVRVDGRGWLVCAGFLRRAEASAPGARPPRVLWLGVVATAESSGRPQRALPCGGVWPLVLGWKQQQALQGFAALCDKGDACSRY